MKRATGWLTAGLLGGCLTTLTFAQPGVLDAEQGRGGADRGQMPGRGGGLRQVEAPRGTAILRGMVVAADNGAAIRRAQVRVSGQGVPTRLTTTDDRGRFEIKELPAGRYRVSASKGGFVTLEYGQRRPAQSGTPIELADRQIMDKLVLGLPRGSVIAGRITDEFGEPLANSVVTAMRYGYQAGARRLMPASGANSRDTTDDQGSFRLFGLPPGEYVVSAAFRTGGGDVTDANADTTGYAPTYFPGTSNPSEAQRVRVDISQEQSGIVFALIATRLVRVSGSVLDAQGVPMAGGNVQLMSTGGTGLQRNQVASTRIDATGQFRLTNVAPGRYTLVAFTARGLPGPRGVGPAGGAPGGPGGVAIPDGQAAPGRGGGPGMLRAAVGGSLEVGTQDLLVGGEDQNGIVIVTALGARVSGAVVTDTGTAPSLQPRQVTIGSRSMGLTIPGPGQGNVRLNDDWTFQIENLFQPRLFRTSLPDGWTLKQVLLNGEDITDAAVEFPAGQSFGGMQIVITEKVSRLSGRVTDTKGTAITDASIVVFPADDRRWTEQSRFVRAARPDQDGNFQFPDLPPLDRYLAVVVQDLEDGQAGDPEFLARVRDQGTAFSLGEGETRALDLRFQPK